jgi:beta-galactosidase
MDRGTDWFAFLQNELHSTNPAADTHIKIMTHLFSDDERGHAIDLEALTELTTMIGDDAKTRGRDLRVNETESWEANYSYYWESLSVPYDFMESVSPNKIHVNSETHFLSSVAWRDLNTSPEYVRNTFWLATLQGMDAGLSWFWARDPDGSPEDRLEKGNISAPGLSGSFAASANMQPQVANELTQVMMDLNSFSEEIMALRRQRRPVRLFHSETSAINKEHHMSEQFDLYESLFFEGFPVGYATENILKKQDPANWDVVLVYKTEYVTDSEFNALQGYLDNGGTVIMDTKLSLAKNEYGQKRGKSLKESKGSLNILEDTNFQTLKKKALNVISDKLPELVLTELNGLAQKGCTWRVASKNDGSFLMTIVNIGKNKAQLKTSLRDGGNAICTNMLTGQVLGSEFELESNGVLLLEIAKR